MDITKDKIKELRDRTGIGIIKCRDVLVEANGNVDYAVEVIRDTALAKAKGRIGIMNEGYIVIRIASDRKKAVLVQGGCETNLISRSKKFSEFCNQVAENSLSDNFCLEGLTADLIAQVQENVTIFANAVFSTEHTLGTYVHVGTIGAIVSIIGGNIELANDIAMHISAEKPSNHADLLCQPFVKNNSITIGELLAKYDAELEDFIWASVDKFRGM